MKITMDINIGEGGRRGLMGVERLFRGHNGTVEAITMTEAEWNSLPREMKNVSVVDGATQFMMFGHVLTIQ